MADYPLLLSCVLLGAFAGFMGGMLGIGGGVIIVPVLVMLFDARHLIAAEHITNVAVATSLTTIVFSSFSAARAQVQRGAVRWDIVAAWAPGLVFCGLLAGLAAPWIPSHFARLFIGGFLCIVALIMSTSWVPAPHRQLPKRMGNVLISSAAGAVSGLAGIGGGNVVVPTLVYFNVAIHNASATASALGVPIALFSAAGYIYSGWHVPGLPSASLGYVYLPAALMIVLTSVITAPLGVRVGHRLPAAQLKRVFGIALALAAARMLYSALR